MKSNPRLPVDINSAPSGLIIGDLFPNWQVPPLRGLSTMSCKLEQHPFLSRLLFPLSITPLALKGRNS